MASLQPSDNTPYRRSSRCRRPPKRLLFGQPNDSSSSSSSTKKKNCPPPDKPTSAPVAPRASSSPTKFDDTKYPLLKWALSTPRGTKRTIAEAEKTTPTKGKADGEKYIGKLFKCLVDDCMEMFQRLHQLNDHLEHCHGVLRCRCYLDRCGLSFADSEQLKRHLTTVHGGRTTFPCAHCHHQLPTLLALWSHTLETHQFGVFRCVTAGCPFVGICRADVLNHYNKVHQRFQCYFEGCTKTFTDPSNRVRHEKSHYPGKVTFACKFSGCSYVKVNKGCVLRHIERAHGQEGAPIDLNQFLEERR